MTPANPDALADALARELARLDGWQDPDASRTDNLGIIARGGEGSPVYLDYVEDAGKLIAGPLAPLLADLQRVTAERDEARKEASDLQNDWADQVAASRQEIERADIAEASLVTAETRADQLRAEVEALKGALKPFAKAGELFGPRERAGWDQLIYSPAAGEDYCIVADHLRAARTALAARAATAGEGS